MPSLQSLISDTSISRSARIELGPEGEFRAGELKSANVFGKAWQGLSRLLSSEVREQNRTVIRAYLAELETTNPGLAEAAKEELQDRFNLGKPITLRKITELGQTTLAKRAVELADGAIGSYRGKRTENLQKGASAIEHAKIYFTDGGGNGAVAGLDQRAATISLFLKVDAVIDNPSPDKASLEGAVASLQEALQSNFAPVESGKSPIQKNPTEYLLTDLRSKKVAEKLRSLDPVNNKAVRLADNNRGAGLRNQIRAFEKAESKVNEGRNLSPEDAAAFSLSPDDIVSKRQEHASLESSYGGQLDDALTGVFDYFERNDPASLIAGLHAVGSDPARVSELLTPQTKDFLQTFSKGFSDIYENASVLTAIKHGNEAGGDGYQKTLRSKIDQNLNKYPSDRRDVIVDRIRTFTTELVKTVNNEEYLTGTAISGESPISSHDFASSVQILQSWAGGDSSAPVAALIGSNIDASRNGLKDLQAS